MGPFNENEIWRIRYNDKIYNLYSEPNIVNIIKVGRLRWIGHIMRMQEDNATRRLLRPDEGRRRGRPKLRWMDGIEEDLRKLGCSWMEKESFGKGSMEECLDCGQGS